MALSSWMVLAGPWQAVGLLSTPIVRYQGRPQRQYGSPAGGAWPGPSGAAFLAALCRLMCNLTVSQP